MFDKILRIEGGPDWRHVYVYTDSWPVAIILVACLLLAIMMASAICYYVTRSVMLIIVGRLARKKGRKWLVAAERHRVFHRLAPLVPAGIVYASAPLLSSLTFPLIAALGRPLAILAACYMVYTLLRAALALRDSIEERYSHFPSASERPIKSFLQIATIVAYLIALIAVVSLLLERSPVYLLTGLSAVTALLIIIFRDSLLGFVASIQLAAYDMLRVGDWIEVPGFVADGTVIDIALNTIKVRNFDNTIVMLPSQLLLTNSVKNWRGMTESGGRRLRHAIHFDADTVRFPDEALLARLHDVIQRPLAAPEGELRTNLGLYRLYLSAYFRDHLAVRRDMPLVIRQVQSREPVVALEICLYVDEIRWEPYENLQSDMLDHAYGVVPLFGLRCWQRDRAPFPTL
ncbi:MscS mechanosensitive ion channel [Caballeronia arationis]|jgi:miniconductance mechanosensitive channel|uniref:Small-conductance mechanosensitive channel n=1 Tax=Caballeronia arationis TaxID=1777142 RepID=A0A7Z7N6T5_9BURK|nr:mechanosensitive ion channel domain-containing protein [Caballeronia arationis]SAK65899.1 MscS mechanosensitive ion channel [Caballeronia arationis]SOE89140.1 Small-conductance mechanosensitive channel [Caballeronia arationis]